MLPWTPLSPNNQAMKTAAFMILCFSLLACASWYALSAFTIGDDEDPPDWP